MAAVDLTPQDVDNEGVESYTDTAEYDAATAVDGFTFSNNGKCAIEILNLGSSGALTVTIVSPNECDQGETHNITQVIPQGDSWISGFFEMSRFNALLTGKITITIDHFDTVSARVYKFAS